MNMVPIGSIFSFPARLDALNRIDKARAKQDLRTQIELLEVGIEKNLPGIETCLQTYFLDGIYVRKFHMQAGSLITSKVHALESFSIISKGVVIIATEYGPMTAVAGSHFFAPAGTKRCLLIKEDCIWSTIHLNPDNERDEDILTARYTLPEKRQLTKDEMREVEAA